MTPREHILWSVLICILWSVLICAVVVAALAVAKASQDAYTPFHPYTLNLTFTDGTSYQMFAASKRECEEGRKAISARFWQYKDSGGVKEIVSAACVSGDLTHRP